MRQAVAGTLNRTARNPRPGYQEIDGNRTIRANLSHHQPSHKTIIPTARLGLGRKRSSLKELILCVD